MKTLRIGDKGPEVAQFQELLRSLGFYKGSVDGDFGPIMLAAVIAYQKRKGVAKVGQPDGVIGRLTWGEAIKGGHPALDEATPTGAFPNLPSGVHAIGLSGSKALFGNFSFVPAPTKSNPEAVRITDGWDKKNLVTVVVPQLITLGLSSSGKVTLNKLIAKQFLGLWDAWEKRGLLHHVISWDGAYVCRFIRGSRTTLSNHAFGSAFDVNAAWNMRGTTGALPGKKGYLWPLVATAVEFGFFWGGWWGSENRGGTPDLMHFECFKLLA